MTLGKEGPADQATDSVGEEVIAATPLPLNQLAEHSKRYAGRPFFSNNNDLENSRYRL